jgi:opacity protein-like surface antigen
MKSKIAAACALATLATLGTSAFAQTYVGVAAGRTNTCIHDPAGECTNDATSVKALVGYAWPNTDFAIEGIYTHLGAFKHGSSRGSVDSKVDTLGVGGAWRPQFGGGFGAVVRGGLAVGRARTDYTNIYLGTPITMTSSSHSQDFWQPYVGAGLTYAVASNIRLEADVDVTRVKATNSPTNARSWMLGATYAF